MTDLVNSEELQKSIQTAISQQVLEGLTPEVRESLISKAISDLLKCSLLPADMPADGARSLSKEKAKELDAGELIQRTIWLAVNDLVRETLREDEQIRGRLKTTIQKIIDDTMEQAVEKFAECYSSAFYKAFGERDYR